MKFNKFRSSDSAPDFTSQFKTKPKLKCNKFISLDSAPGFTLQFKTKPKTKVSSLPNLNRETTSYSNFFSLYQDLDHHSDTTREKCPSIDHSVGTEASETSPFKDIPSQLVSWNEIGICAAPSSVMMCRRESEQKDWTLPSTSSVGSNEFSGDGGTRSEGTSPTQLWWDQCNYPDYPEDEFRRAFKMSKSTFNLICTQLESIVVGKDMMLQLALPFTPPISQRVAVCIWFLATGERLRLVSKRFGLGISTCHKLVLEVCTAIMDVLKNKYLNWPDHELMTGIKSKFELFSGIRNVGGSMYTTHVPISAPEVNGPAYFNKRHIERNQKTSYTVTVQGVVDSKGIFTDVCIGRPGSMTDDKILETSEISLRASQGLLKDVWIVGNSGYPLMDWVLVPYAQRNLWREMVFNERVGCVQRVAKEAFKRLKGRWRCLQEITEVELHDLPVVLGACCVLHNICEMNDEAMDPADAIFEIVDDEIAPENRVRSVAAVRYRDQIAYHLLKAEWMVYQKSRII